MTHWEKLRSSGKIQEIKKKTGKKAKDQKWLSVFTFPTFFRNKMLINFKQQFEEYDWKQNEYDYWWPFTSPEKGPPISPLIEQPCSRAISLSRFLGTAKLKDDTLLKHWEGWKRRKGGCEGWGGVKVRWRTCERRGARSSAKRGLK